MDDHGKAIIPAQVDIEARELPRLHPAVAAVMSGQIPPDVLRQVLEIQREYEAGEARKAFTRALVNLKRDLPAVLARDKAVDFTSGKGRTHYTHTSLAAAMDAVTEPLAAHGFSISWIPATDGDRLVRVTCRLTHRDGHHEETTLAAPPDDRGLKSSAQAIASTVTLLSRYTLLAMLGIATGDQVEPRGEAQADPAQVDQARNLRAAAALRSLGLDVSDVEADIGRPVAEWTAEDLGVVRAIYDEERAARAPAPPAEREPGEEG